MMLGDLYSGQDPFCEVIERPIFSPVQPKKGSAGSARVDLI